jgi:hypothetical protein
MWGEMTLPNRNNLKAQITRQTSYHSQRLGSLKPGLKPANKIVFKANRKTHLNNKRLYERKATLGSFKVEKLSI